MTKNLAPNIAHLQAAKAAAQQLRSADTGRKNAVLLEAARLLDQRKGQVLAANAEDLNTLAADAGDAFRDRLLLDVPRIAQMVESLGQVARLEDPVNEEVERKTLANGLLVRRLRSPLGVILMIFESRPNVAVEAFSLAFKAGNVIILRGGKESMRTTAVLYDILGDALESQGFDRAALWGITDPDRKLTEFLLEQASYIDIVVPRGGDALIKFVVDHARMPIIKNDRGLCHVYVHEDADQPMAVKIIANAKCQRPGVCNSLETVLVNRRISRDFLTRLHERLAASKVEWFGDAESVQLLKGQSDVHAATTTSFDTEYLDLKMNCRVVGSLDEAIAHIEKHGSRHSESIITKTEAVAREFQARIDAAAVYWNASTRFTDGFELGLGGELGISTQKLHVRGPVGLRELTNTRWLIDGTGQIRK
ncbi:MAG: glutamate-5-semialdehyde dehydrogenase [Deltaproteobacteria bacterium]|nr:glutamate-5-semialdehyde dehydrogenase [Deltaproteobacteria bacterium]